MQNKTLKKTLYFTLALLFWISLWQIASVSIGQEILLVSPGKVFLRFFKMLTEKDFWMRTLFSLCRIGCGFCLAGITGCILSAVSYHFNLIRELLKPLIFVLKTVPVASFIILALLMVSSRNLSILISFMMCLPVFFTNVLQGLDAQDRKLLEMSKVFRLTPLQTLRFVTIPQLRPYLFSAFSLAMGFGWKSGIAAEVLGIPDGSLGEKLYESKIYFQTADLFAYTLAIILISVILERLFTFSLRRILKYEK